jgi:hypothetical protein
MAKSSSLRTDSEELSELLHCIEQLGPAEGPRRLQLDLIRDAAMELNSSLQRRIAKAEARVGRRDKKLRRLQRRWRHLLADLADGPTRFTQPADWPATSNAELLALYEQLLNRDYPAAVALLRDVSGGRASQCLRLLVEQVLIQGRLLLVEYLARQGSQQPNGESTDRFLDRLGQYLLRKVGKSLARQTGFAMSAEVSGRLNGLIQESLQLLLGLFVSEPVMRLVVPSTGQPFDSACHEASASRPLPANPVVAAILFPGLRSFEGQGSLLHRTRVAIGVKDSLDRGA